MINLFFSKKEHVTTILGFVHHAVKCVVGGKKAINSIYYIDVSNKILFINIAGRIQYNATKLSNFLVFAVLESL